MLIYAGNNAVIRDDILRRLKASPQRVHAEENILAIQSADGRAENFFFEDGSECAIMMEGRIFNDRSTSLAAGILPFYSKHGLNFPLHIDGLFNLAIWDKKKNELIVVNDKLGLNPMYYAPMSDGSVVFSSRLKSISSIDGFDRQVDEVALVQYAYANYVMGKRTLMKGISRLRPASIVTYQAGQIKEAIYWTIYDVMHLPSIDEHDFYEQFADAFLKTLAQWVQGKGNIGVLLSGGYDSRSILACLAKIGIKGTAYTWDNPRVKETGIAQELARQVGFKHRFIPSDPSTLEVDDLINEVETNTDFQFPLFHIGRYYAVKTIMACTDVLFSGQGELIRVPAVPNDYVNGFVLNVILTGSALTDYADHFFNRHLSGETFVQAFGEIRDARQAHTGAQVMTSFLLNDAYRNDYGMLKYGESTEISVVMPFLSYRLIELLFRSKYSIVRTAPWHSNIFSTYQSRRIYHDLLKRTVPGLLKVNLDRGYPQSWDRDLRGFVSTCLWGLKNRQYSKKARKIHDTSSWVWFIRGILNEPRTLDREYLHRQDILQSLSKGTFWEPGESYELEKAARFELWYRYFIENGK